MDWSRFLKIPYKINGRTEQGADCYGLFLIIQREVFKKNYDDVYYLNGLKSRENAIEKQKKKYNFQRIDTAKIGCAVVMYNRGIPSHIGIYVGDGKVIHTKETTGVIIEEVKNCDVEGYYEDTLL